MEEKVNGVETVEEIRETGENVTKETAASAEAKASENAGALESAQYSDMKDRNQELRYFVNKVENPDTRHYIESRVVNEMEYYRITCAKYKQQYIRFMTTSIILGALIPVASVLSSSTTLMKVIIAGLGSSVTAINAFLGLNNSRDLWLTYRDTRNTLLRTLYYYFNNTSPFEKMSSQEEKDRQLIQACEKILANENSSWIDANKE